VLLRLVIATGILSHLPAGTRVDEVAFQELRPSKPDPFQPYLDQRTAEGHCSIARPFSPSPGAAGW
jgi:hypothetical protein